MDEVFVFVENIKSLLIFTLFFYDDIFKIFYDILENRRKDSLNVIKVDPVEFRDQYGNVEISVPKDNKPTTYKLKKKIVPHREAPAEIIAYPEFIDDGSELLQAPSSKLRIVSAVSNYSAAHEDSLKKDNEALEKENKQLKGMISWSFNATSKILSTYLFDIFLSTFQTLS